MLLLRNYFATSWLLFTQVGEGQLSMSFVGQLNDKLKGFYRSKYLSPEGEERYGAVTQFEVNNDSL